MYRSRAQQSTTHDCDSLDERRISIRVLLGESETDFRVVCMALREVAGKKEFHFQADDKMITGE